MQNLVEENQSLRAQLAQQTQPAILGPFVAQAGTFAGASYVPAPMNSRNVGYGPCRDQFSTPSTSDLPNLIEGQNNSATLLGSNPTHSCLA